MNKDILFYFGRILYFKEIVSVIYVWQQTSSKLKVWNNILLYITMLQFINLRRALAGDFSIVVLVLSETFIYCESSLAWGLEMVVFMSYLVQIAT